MKLWARAVHVAAAKRFSPIEKALGDADFVHAEARARPAATILTARLFFRFSPMDFVSWFRFHAVPSPSDPHLGNADFQGLERCRSICARR